MSKKNETSIFQPVENFKQYSKLVPFTFTFPLHLQLIPLVAFGLMCHHHLPCFSQTSSSSVLASVTAWKVSRYEVFSGPYFPAFRTNTGKYGPKKTPYLDTFHAVRSFLKSIRQFPVWPWKYTLAARASQSTLLYTSPNNSSSEDKQIQHNLSFT